MSEGSALVAAQSPPRHYRRAYVEISNICNLKCSFCPTVERASQVMTAADFARLAPQVKLLADEVCLHLMGEPLNHPEFAQVLAACRDVSLPINLTTNGLLLSGSRLELALSPVVRQVNLSAHSFAANFPGKSPDAYLARLLLFVRRALAERPDLYINLRLWDLPEPTQTSLQEAVRLRLAAEFAVDFGAVDIRRKKAVQLAGRVYVHFDSRFEWPHPDLPKRSERGFCHGLSGHFAVHADGTVVPCCLDKEAVIALGNVNVTPLAEVLSSDRAERMRDGFDRGELVEDLCQKCPFIARFDRKARRLGQRQTGAPSLG